MSLRGVACRGAIVALRQGMEGNGECGECGERGVGD